MLEFLFAQSPPVDQVLDRIRQDPTLSGQVRKRTLEQAEPYWKNLVVHDAQQRVYDLYDQAASERRSWKGFGSIPPSPSRSVNTPWPWNGPIPESASRLDWAARIVARQPGAAPTAYQLALRQAEAAFRVASQQDHLLTTLGMAQYRVGRYTEAAATLTQADRINSVAPSGPVPTDLAFLALSCHRLCRFDEARAPWAGFMPR